MRVNRTKELNYGTGDRIPGGGIRRAETVQKDYIDSARRKRDSTRRKRDKDSSRMNKERSRRQ